MKRPMVILAAAALAVAPLTACGKKGDPESEPERVKLQMPAPIPPPAQPPAQVPAKPPQ
ncbi:MAG: hypothetical protein ACT4N4_05390 [Rhodospirillales bacterium]